MLMKDMKKSAVSLIVKKAKGPNHMDNLKFDENQESVEMPETKDGIQQDKSIPQEAAAEELIHAMEMKSPAAIVEAMKALIELCQSEEDKENEKY